MRIKGFTFYYFEPRQYRPAWFNGNSTHSFPPWANDSGIKCDFVYVFIYACVSLWCLHPPMLLLLLLLLYPFKYTTVLSLEFTAISTSCIYWRPSMEYIRHELTKRFTIWHRFYGFPDHGQSSKKCRQKIVNSKYICKSYFIRYPIVCLHVMCIYSDQF